MRPANLLILLSDQHRRDTMSALGHPAVHTPTLDALAARGVRFSAAYCNSPICVPARASLATGNYVHRHRYWDNAMPYDGTQASWGHRLRAAGRKVVSVGKLHYRSAEDDNGFNEEIIPYHVKDGVGDAQGLLRQDLLPMKLLRRFVEEAGPGESWVTEYDREVTRRACDWLQQAGTAPASDAPWVLLVSLICPHPPLRCPEPFFNAVDPDAVPLPPDERPSHPSLADVRKRWLLEAPLSEAVRRQAARAYYGLSAFMDDNLRQVLDALEASGQAGNTRVVYTSDHGESLGDQGVWGKSLLHEGAAGVPLLLAGEGIPQGQVCSTAVSHVDLFPTFLELSGVPLSPAESFLPGNSLVPLAQGGAEKEEEERYAFSEYHAAGSRQAGFMVRQGDWKLIHYHSYPEQLFNLASDPEEAHNLAPLAEHAGPLQHLRDLLSECVITKAADDLAKADQARRVQELGGREAVLHHGELRARSPLTGEQFAR